MASNQSDAPLQVIIHFCERLARITYDSFHVTGGNLMLCWPMLARSRIFGHSLLVMADWVSLGAQHNLYYRCPVSTHFILHRDLMRDNNIPKFCKLLSKLDLKVNNS